MFHAALWVITICNLIGISIAFLRLPPPQDRKDRLFQEAKVLTAAVIMYVLSAGIAYLLWY
jgi:hypothetical protein